MSVLETAMVWPPVEAMTQVSRNSQKLIAKDVASFATHAKTIAAALPKETAGSSAVSVASLPMKTKLAMTKSLQAMMKEVQTLKKKLTDSSVTASRHASTCANRLHYLQQVDQLAADNRNGTAEYETMEDEVVQQPEEEEEEDEKSTSSQKRKRATKNTRENDMDIDSTASNTTKSVSKSSVATDDTPNFTVTPQMRVDRLFADHLLRTSQYHEDRPSTAALLVASSPALGSLVDSTLFTSARKISTSLLEQHDCTRALAWCGENRSRLNKIGSTLEFDLRLQEFLTLVQNTKTMEAIEYARKYLVPATMTSVTTASAAPPASTPALERTASLPERLPETSTGLLIRNNSLGPPSSSAAAGAEEKKEEPLMIADPARVKILQEAMNLLVFYGFEDSAPDASNSNSSGVPPAWHKYRVYWSPTRFHELLRTFEATHLALYGLPEESVLESILNIGLSCIKTSSCQCSDGRREHNSQTNHDDERMEMEEEEEEKASYQSSSASAASTTPPSSGASSHHPLTSCPACTPPFSYLANSLNVAQRSHSRLVCRLSGALMDDKNPPMVLPNGSVYSKNALTQMAKDNDGLVTCQRTKEQFTFAQAKVMYVL